MRRRWAWGLFAAALALRLVHLFTIRDSPFFSILYIDPLMYDEWGQRIAAGEWMSERPFFLDPLYPYFLGAVFAIFGHHYEPVIALQSLFGALVAPLTYLAARRWFDEAAARTAGLIAAFYLPGVYFGSLVMKPGLAMFLMAVVLWQLSRNLDRPRPLWQWLATGVVLGLGCLTRGNLLLVVPPLVLFALLRATEERPNWLANAFDRMRRLEAAGLAAGVALVLALPLAHNVAVGGEWILTTANAGANFYIGNNPANRSGEYQQLPFIRANPKWEQTDFTAEALRRSGRRTMTDREVSSFWFDESLKWVKSDPGGWVWLMGRKLRSFWGSWEIPDSVDYYFYREHAPVLRLPLPGFGLLAPLALTGMALAWRRRGWPRAALLLVAVYAASVIVFFVFSRFRMVVAPALYAFAGFAAIELYRRLRERQGRELTIALLLFAAAFAFVNLPVRARTDSLGYRVAARLGIPTKPETSVLGRLNLGLAYARDAKEADDPAAKLAEAERLMRAALDQARDLDHARIHIELGKVLARQGRNREAIEIYRAGLAYEPAEHTIYHALGLLHSRENEPQAALAAFLRANEIQPNYLPSLRRSARLLQQLGRSAEARALYRRVLELKPGDPEAQQALR